MNIWTEFQTYFSDALKLVADQLSFLGAHRWAATIVVLTVTVKTLLLPLAIKQVRSMQSMQKLQPELKRLQQKHKGDRQKLNEEMMQLYRREGVNPLGGCLPIVAQMPVFFAMFYAIRGVNQTVKYMPFLGLGNLADNAIESAAGIGLLAIMTVTSFLTARQTTLTADPQQARLMKIMPFFFVFIMFRFPAGLVLYWTTQNVYQLVQQTIMLRGQVPVPVAGKQGKPHGGRPHGGKPQRLQGRPAQKAKARGNNKRR